jgi:outer membrane protein TolC
MRATKSRRAALLGLSLGALAVSNGCVPTSVDYAPLERAAEARQRAAGANPLPLERDVAKLLMRPLTAESAARIALLNNRALRAKLDELAIAQAARAEVERLPNPTLEGAMRFRGDDDPELELGAMIDLSELLLALTRGGAAGARVEAEKLFTIGSIVDLSFEAREAFLDYQAALEALELRKTVMQGLEATAVFSQRLREAGNVTELSHAQQQSLFEESRLELRRAEMAALAARERLSTTMGVWGRDLRWSTQAKLPDPPARELDLEALESEAVRRSLALQGIKQRYAAASRRVTAARAGGWLPELKAGVSAERDESWAVGPALELELPLFYQGRGAAAAATAELRQQQNLYADAAVRVRSSAREIAARLRTAREAVLHYRSVVLPLKRKILDEALLEYNAMLIGVPQLLQVKREQVETQANYIAQLREYWALRNRAAALLAGGSASPFPALAIDAVRVQNPAH